MTTLHNNLLLSILVACVWSVVGQQCPSKVNDAIQRCVLPVAQYAKVLNAAGHKSTEGEQKSEFGQAIALPNLGGDVFRELCGLIRRFDICVKESRRECPRHITISLIDASYGFLCNEGYEIFMDSADCLMELDQRPSVKACHDRTLKEIQNANDQIGMRLPEKMSRMCDSLNYFAGCVRQPIRQMCGIEAWTVIFRVLRDTTHTLMPGCEFSSNSLPSGSNEGEEQSQGGEPLEALSSSSSREPTDSLEGRAQVGRVNSNSRGEMEISVVNPTGSFEKTFSSSISRHTNASASVLYRSGGLTLIIFALFLLTVGAH